MSAVDFAAWAVEDLVLTLDDHTYRVRPPSVAGMRMLLASAVQAEVNLGLKVGPVPPEVQQVIDGFGPDDHPALGDVHDQLVNDGAHPTEIDRMGYYAVFYWARGKEFADWLATVLWAPREVGEGGPKG